MIGLEVLKCINCFLNIRQSALPRRIALPVTGVSQDEFGMFEMDYTDAAFDDLLGGGGAAGPADVEKENKKQKDLEFAAVRPSFLLGRTSTHRFPSSSLSEQSSPQPSFASFPTFSPPTCQLGVDLNSPID